jgi:hypothetical protein
MRSSGTSQVAWSTATRATTAPAFSRGEPPRERPGRFPVDVDLENGLIRVERSWDKVEGFTEPKSSAGRRTVPICAHLRSYLAEGNGFYFCTAEGRSRTGRRARGHGRHGATRG